MGRTGPRGISPIVAPRLETVHSRHRSRVAATNRARISLPDENGKNKSSKTQRFPVFQPGYGRKRSKRRRSFRSQVGLRKINQRWMILTISLIGLDACFFFLTGKSEMPLLGHSFFASILQKSHDNLEAKALEHYSWGENTGHAPIPLSMRGEENKIFTGLTSEEQQRLEGMHDNFDLLKASGRLSPCRLDDFGSCFRETALSYISNYLRSFLHTTPNSTGSGLLLLRNQLPEDRFWCGHRIYGNGGTLTVNGLPKECGDEKENESALPYVYSKGSPKLFGYDSDTSHNSDGDDVIPIELVWNADEREYQIDDENPSRNDKPFTFPCSVPCVTNDNFMIVNTINVRNTPWRITHTMEGEVIYSEAHVRAAGYRENQYYATTSFRSEIPLPYFSWSEYNIQHTAVDFGIAIKGASFLANNCDSYNNRERVVQALIQNTTLRVDSLSGCLNNAGPLPGVDMSNKTSVMEHYLFHLAFENQNADDYITEKLWGALASGTLPVYFGAQNIKDHVPEHSVVVAADFDSPLDLGEYLYRLTSDKKLYESYHEWRYKPIGSDFRNKYAFTKTHSNCRMCRWAYAKRHGLGWNHAKQVITKPAIDHKTCRNKIGLIAHPFKEYWSMVSPQVAGDANASTTGGVIRDLHIDSQDGTKTCTLTQTNRIVDINHGAIIRKVYDGDGITDLIIDVTSRVGGTKGATNSQKHGIYVLRLEMPIQIDASNSQPHVVNDSVWWFQDESSRFLIMVKSTDFEAKLSIDSTGMIEIKMPPTRSSSTTVRVRIVTEDVDHFHQKTRKTATYFGDLMTRDFFEPIESFRIGS